MTPIIILFALSAMFLGFAIWNWRMPEKRWVNNLKADRNMLGIDYSKYNQKKIRSATTTLLLFEAVCLLSIGLCSWCSARRVNTRSAGNEKGPIYLLSITGVDS